MSAAAQALIGAPSALAGRLAGWARQGIESFVAVQKILLELTAQQNALAIGVVRERFTMPDFRPGDTLADLADQGVSAVTSAGKILLDLAAGETDLMIDGLKEAFRIPPIAGGVADVVRHRVDTVIDMQRRLLDAAAEQTHMVIEGYKEGKGLMAGTSPAELARQALAGFVRTEKKFLDMVAEDVTAATEAAKEGRKAAPARNRTKILTQVARDGVNQYIEAQRKLMELAIDQFETARKAAGAIAEEVEAEPRTPWSEITQKSVKNFVAAQKSILDLAIRPAKETASTPEHHRPRRPVRKPRAAKKVSA